MGIKIGRGDHLLGRMKAGLERLLARRPQVAPPPEQRSLPTPAYHRIFEILGEPNRKSEGPAKGA